MTEIRIGSGKCNNERFKVLDLSRFKNLESVVIGSGSFYWSSLELKSILIHIE